MVVRLLDVCVTVAVVVMINGSDYCHRCHLRPCVSTHVCLAVDKSCELQCFACQSLCFWSLGGRHVTVRYTDMSDFVMLGQYIQSRRKPHSSALVESLLGNHSTAETTLWPTHGHAHQRKVRGWSSDTSSSTNPAFRGSSKGKSSKVVELMFCSNCNFSVQARDTTGFQVTNGILLASNQVLPDVYTQFDDTSIQVCDNCKCSGTATDSTMMLLEGECDLYHGIDVLEFTVASGQEPSTVALVCPDPTYWGSAACETYTLPLGGGPRVPTIPSNAGITSLVVEGPVVTIDVAVNTYASCTVVCSNPNPPVDQPLLSPSKSSKKGKSKSDGQGKPSSKTQKSILEMYDPFADKFPL